MVKLLGLWIIRLALFVITLAIVWSFSLPLYVDVLLALLIGAIAFRAALSSLGLMSVSLALGAGLLALCVPYLMPMSQFYREHEKYAGGGRYLNDVDDVIQMPHGDLAAIDKSLPTSLFDPRTVHFKTDDLGFRNNEPYHGQKVVVMGDSFALGNGTDWKDTISGVLHEEYGIDTYNFSYPSDPVSYYERANRFLKEISSDVSFVFFFYEGNDFFSPDMKKGVAGEPMEDTSWWISALNDYDSFRSKWLAPVEQYLPYVRQLFILSRRLERSFFDRASSRVEVHADDHIAMAFLTPQGEMATKANLELQPPFPEVLAEKTLCAFLIPVKQRVYKDLMPEDFRQRLQEPSSALRVLNENLSGTGVPVIDLSPILAAAATRERSSGRTVYWRDDTHWNGLAVRAVAPEIVRCIHTPSR